MPSGPRIRHNNVFGVTTDNPLTIGATTLNSSGLQNLPVVASAHAVITLDPLRQHGEPEIVIVTAHTASATVATIQRGAYGTTARAHPQGTVWVHAPIDEDVTEILTSGTRPSDPYAGQMIFETDTDKFVARNAANGAWVDAIPLGAWTSYTPTLTQSGAVTKTVTYAKYVQIGKTVVGSVKLDVTGTGTSSNAVVVGLPVTGAQGSNGVIGSGFIYDSSANIFYGGILRVVSTTTVNFTVTSTDGPLQLGAATFTAALASGDIVSLHFTYEAA